MAHQWITQYSRHMGKPTKRCARSFEPVIICICVFIPPHPIARLYIYMYINMRAIQCAYIRGSIYIILNTCEGGNLARHIRSFRIDCDGRDRGKYDVAMLRLYVVCVWVHFIGIYRNVGWRRGCGKVRFGIISMSSIRMQ